MLSLNKAYFKYFQVFQVFFDGLKMFSCNMTLKYNKTRNATLTVCVPSWETSFLGKLTLLKAVLKRMRKNKKKKLHVAKGEKKPIHLHFSIKE